MRVLHVDDDEFIRELVRVSLVEIAGFELLQCHDGPSAIASVEEYRPDLLLLDYSMPGMTGEEALLEIRLRAGFETVPCVFLTALDSAELVDRLLGLGGLEVIPKPVDFVQLPVLIRNALCRKNVAS